MPEIDIHPLIAHANLERDVAESLRANALKPKLLYMTPRQTELWRQVFLRHSPIHGNPEFARIYREAYARVAEERPARKVWLIGLGCGTGLKEAELCSRLKSEGHEVAFSAIDVSHDLVSESARRLEGAGAKSGRHLVCDLTEIDFIKEWLGRIDEASPRIFTFFGLVPNLHPPFVARLVREILRSGDTLLVNAHLAPLGEGGDLPAAMRSVLPQYDNPETLAWLTAALEHWGLHDLVEGPRMTIGEREGVPAFVARASWKSNEPFEKGGHAFAPGMDEPLRVFQSLRYTVPLFEDLLRCAEFKVELLAETGCREEAIWRVSAARPEVDSTPSELVAKRQ